MTDMERIDAAIEWASQEQEFYNRTSKEYQRIETILEALRFQKAAMGEPREAVISAAWESQFKSVGATDEEAKMLGKKRYEDQKNISIPAYKAMIAELAKQVKENEYGR